MFCVFSTASPIWAKDSIIKLFSVYIVNTVLYGIYSKSNSITSQCLFCGYYENEFKVEFHNSLFAMILKFFKITILSQNINSFI